MSIRYNPMTSSEVRKAAHGIFWLIAGNAILVLFLIASIAVCWLL